MEEKGKEGLAVCRCPYCEEEIAFCKDLPAICRPCSIVIVMCASCGGPVREGSDTCPSCGGKP